MCRFMKTAALAIFLLAAANTPSAQLLPQHNNNVSYSHIIDDLHHGHRGDGQRRPASPAFSEINTSALIAAGIGLLGLRLLRRN